jgi:hypothetical protein
MAEEIYSRPRSQNSYVSPSQIRKQQKKALQSYRHITTIQKSATQEQKAAANEAEQELDQFITSSSRNGK